MVVPSNRLLSSILSSVGAHYVLRINCIMDFRLLVETRGHPSQASLLLEGKCWAMSSSLDLESNGYHPPYACISYRWGTAREPHAMIEGITMSAQALPSLAAAIRSSSSNAFWTDVFCLPPSGLERQATLERMGYIYSRAAEVIVVLGEDTFSVIQNMMNGGPLDATDLRTMERDEWVSSVWTYQEIVNASLFRFVSSSGHQVDRSVSIEGADILNSLGFSLMKWQNSTGSDTFATMRAFPNLNALETILVDWQTAAYIRRSAYSVLCSMASKRNPDPANYFYAILGVLSQDPQELVWNSDQNPAEKFMAICEHKNDFSFIYSVAVRDSDPRLCWRPRASALPVVGTNVPAILRPIFAWHVWGEAQQGHHDESGLWLDGMTVMQPASTVGDAGRKTILDWMRQPESEHLDDTAMGRLVHAAISSVGFEGRAEPIKITEGLIFTQEIPRGASIVRIVVSNQIRYVMGAPGLVQIKDKDEKQYLPSLFIGEVARLLGGGESVLL